MPCLSTAWSATAAYRSGSQLRSVMAGAGADHQRGLCVGNEVFGVGQRAGEAAGCPSAGAGAATPSASANPRKLSSTCSRWRARDAPVGEQPLQLARARLVEAELHRRRDQRRGRAGADRQLQMQQQVEAAAPLHLGAQPAVSGEAGTLVHGDKLHIRNEAHQLRFEFADHPRESRARPGVLQRAQQRHHVAGVPDRGEAQQADFLRRCGHCALHAVPWWSE